MSAAPPPIVPDALRDRLAGYRRRRVSEGESGAAVLRLTAPDDEETLYLKCASGPAAPDLAGEAARLRWLGARLPAAEVLDLVRHGDRAWLLLRALPGQSVARRLARAGAAERGRLVEALAGTLRRLHAIPARDCPFPADCGTRLAQARARIDAGLVDTADFDEVRAGWTAEQVWSALLDLRPTGGDRVVVHGDFTPENVFCHGGAISGCIDAGRLGTGDRYQDIALAWRGLADYGPALQQRFLAAVGADPPDRQRLEFHLLLDELF